MVALIERKREVVISGHAIAPQGTVMFETKKLITVALVIEWETGVVLNAEATFMTRLCNDFFKEIVIGKNFVEDYEQIKYQVQRDLHVDSKKALLKALSVANERYKSLWIKEFTQDEQIDVAEVVQNS